MILQVLILYSLFGFSFTIGKMILFYASPFFIVALRMLIGGACLLTYIYAKHRIRCYPQKSDMWLYIQNAVFGTYLFYSLRAWSLQYITTTKAALLFNLFPFFTAIISYFHLKERFSIQKVFGLSLGFLGMIPLLINNSSYEDLIGGVSFLSWPELLMIAAVASLSYSTVVMQKLVKHRQCPPVLANGVSMLIGGAMALTSAMLVEPIWIRGDCKMLALLAFVQIVISNLICSNLQAHLLRHYSTTFLSLASFLSPLSAVIYGWLFFHETVTWHFFASFATVFIGLVLYHFDELRKKIHAN